MGEEKLLLIREITIIYIYLEFNFFYFYNAFYSQYYIHLINYFFSKY